MTTTIDQGAREALRAGMLGEVVTPDDAGYDDARRIWNGHIDRRPALIARCRGAADVMAAVRFARDYDALLAVRGGGHAVAGHASCDGGVVIDLSQMTGSRVDPLARTIRLEGGCLNAHLDREAQTFGLAATSGFVSHTGVAGLTLGGGIGHLMRKFGLSIDSLRSCDVVTADGEFVVASEEQNADLFWGLRGGGGNFGIVTSLEFQLHPLGPEVLAGMQAWPMDEAPRVLRFLREFAADAPDEVGIMGNLRLAPPLPVVPEELHGKPIAALVLTYAGPADEGAEVLRAVQELGPPAVNTLAPKPYAAHQKSLDAAVPHGRAYYWKAHKLGPLEDEIIDVIVEHASQITSPMSSIPVFTQGGAVARVPEDDTAYPHRDAVHDLNIVASCGPGDPDFDRHVAWVRGFYDALDPYSKGVYVNFVNDEPIERVRGRAYSDAQWTRLVGLKAKYDP
ncbi:MAG: FAD-binding oxidoreductase, partial [Acidimicrobiia bacterium]